MLIVQLAPAGSGSANELVWQQEASQVTQNMLAKGYTQLARDWRNFYPGFHSSHPALSVNQVGSAFVATELAKGLGKAIPPIGTFVGRDVPGAAAAAAEKVANSGPFAPLGQIGDFFHRLTEASTWIRVGEVAAGLLLVYIGIKAVVTPGGASVAGQGVKSTAVRIGKKVPGITRVAVRKASEADIRRRERAVGIRARHARQGPRPEGRRAPYITPRGKHVKT